MINMTEETCQKCKEVKSKCKCTDDGNSKELKVTVDTGNIQAVMKRMAEIEQENKRLNDEAKKAAEEKVTISKTIEEQKKSQEELEKQIKANNDAKLAERQRVLLDRVKQVITDPAKVKEYEEKLKDPTAISGIEYSIDTLATVVAEGKKQHEDILKKEKEDFEKRLAEKTGGAGTLPSSLNSGEGGAGGSGDKGGEEFEGATLSEANANMVRELRKRSHSNDPEVAAKAKSQIQEMMRKWGAACKRNYDSQAQGLGEVGPKSIKEQPSLRKITKLGGEAI
jgi:hypothetical protein